jgi:hypothetical protein
MTRTPTTSVTAITIAARAFAWGIPAKRPPLICSLVH